MHASRGGGIQRQFPRLHPEGRLGDLLNHPAFQGFSRLMLPWDGMDYDEAMPLKDVGQLLPYHSHVMPGPWLRNGPRHQCPGLDWSGGPVLGEGNEEGTMNQLEKFRKG